MSDYDDYSAGLRGETRVGRYDTAAYRQGQMDRMRSGPAGFAGMAGEAAPGVLMILPFPMTVGILMFLGTVGVYFATVFFPVGGGLTLLAYWIFYAIMYDPAVSSVVILFVFMIPGFVIFIASMVLESKLAQNRVFRRIRYGWRMLLIPFLGYSAIVILKDVQPPDGNSSWGEIFPMSHVITVVVSFIAAHFLSKRLDRGYDSNAAFGGGLMALRSIPTFRESHLEVDDDEIRRREGIYKEFLDKLVADGHGESPKAAKTRELMEEQGKILAVRERMRAEVAALKRKKPREASSE